MGLCRSMDYGVPKYIWAGHSVIFYASFLHFRTLSSPLNQQNMELRRMLPCIPCWLSVNSHMTLPRPSQSWLESGKLGVKIRLLSYRWNKQHPLTNITLSNWMEFERWAFTELKKFAMIISKDRTTWIMKSAGVAIGVDIQCVMLRLDWDWEVIINLKWTGNILKYEVQHY